MFIAGFTLLCVLVSTASCSEPHHAADIEYDEIFTEPPNQCYYRRKYFNPGTIIRDSYRASSDSFTVVRCTNSGRVAYGHGHCGSNKLNTVGKKICEKGRKNAAAKKA